MAGPMSGTTRALLGGLREAASERTRLPADSNGRHDRDFVFLRGPETHFG